MDRQGPARRLVDIDPASVELDPSGTDLEPLGSLGEEAFQDGCGFPSEDPIVPPGKPRVREAGGPSREDPFIGRLDVRVGTDNETDLSIKVPSEGDFFGGRLGVEIDDHNRRLCLEHGQFPGSHDERILEGCHECPPLEVQDTQWRTTRTGDHGAPTTRNLGRIVGRTHEARFRLQELGHLALVPEMVPGGDDVDTGGKDLGRGGGRDSGAAGGVLAIGHDVVEPEGLPEHRDPFPTRPSPGFTHDVSDEQNAHQGEVGPTPRRRQGA